jgi:dTDP-4-dehydrorhamnose 3,5-epimerase
MELFRTDELSHKNHPAMSYISITKPGTSRGPHEHRRQTDLFCFLGFSDFRVYLWDNRKQSPSFGKRFTFDCRTDHPMLVIVPPGVVHAYRNMGRSDGLVINSPNRLYRGRKRTREADEIRHEQNPDSPFKLNG